ncbi:probable cytochrome P450 6a13 [Macrosteles quadrilineatus]|uniref:probable cytochrome P450 6a13 n=1 Tax=Macrosteles quadrilineatus TaxID=74068 RepID=UPI0023E0B2F0|nr:probable cytochrome P450 6a13 [Macrosteles quadrilineatus]XP_054288641.1 probable cytochrome P450 6a13 [Macrosteles quadrilineatus]XP_054288642.1 probable cytochrome P450 6a13 [Macrosteles quadrilineatus]
MGLILEHASTEILYIFALAVFSIYWYLTKNYNYWEKRNVPHKRPEFPFGSTKEIALAKTFTGKAHDNIYNEFPNERYYGIIEFRKPALVIKDPELIKKIMVKDFQHFVDRPVLMGNPDEYILKHLLTLKGQEWKEMRSKLTPTFTSGKMKLMFQLMEKCSEQLKEQIESEIEKNSTIDAKNLLARFTLEIIASCAFGIETNAIADQNTEFYRIFGKTMKTNMLRYIRRIFLVVFPGLISLLRINLVKPETRDFVTNLIKDTIEYRKKNNIKRNDFLDLLTNVKPIKSSEENGHENGERPCDKSDGLTIEQMSAQTFVFLIAGFETASSLMSFCLYELARHPKIQERLHREVKDAVERNGGKMSYQLLHEMPYLDQVINEALRLYGTGQVLTRVCTQPYQVPDSDLLIEMGMKIIIPLFSLHHDPHYYSDPYTFDPERFSDDQVKKRHPYVFMPFGEGPRNCIGMRFGQTQAKVGLATVVLNFLVDLSPEQEVPIAIDNKAIVMMPAKPVLLMLQKRT